MADNPFLQAKPPVEKNPFLEAPADGSTSTDETPKSKTPMQRIGQLGESGLGGAVMGMAAPEITQMVGKGVSMLPSPYTKAAGYGIEAAGRGMRSMRGTEAGLGALGGMTGDVAGQVAESKGFRPPAVFAAELLGGTVGPAFAQTITKAIQYGSRKLLGLEPVAALKTVASDLGLDQAVLSPSQKKFIQEQIDNLRGGKPSAKAQEGLYDTLKTGAANITKQAESSASLKRQQAEEALKGSEAQAEKMRLAGKKTTDIGAQTSKEAQAARSQIGQDREASDIGNTLREKINSIFGDMARQRSSAYQQQKALRDAAVAEKESAGQLVKDVPEYKSLIEDLRNKLLIGKEAQKQATAPVTEKGVLQAYQNIYDAVTNRRVMIGVDTNGNPAYKTFPTSFEALDDVRRRLGDAAYGKEVEGYSAIGAKIAEKYYGKISDIQSKFAGEAHDALQGGYESASRLLDKYKSKAGKRATVADRFDPSRYQTDAASLPNDYFKTQQSVKDLLELTGGDKGLVTQAASDFSARQLRDKNAKSVRSWLSQNGDWLSSPELSSVKSKIESYANTLERAERVSGKTGKAAQILESREPTVLREGAKALAAGEQQAGAITAEAQKRVNTILGDSSPAKRIREIILGGKQSVWNEVGPILASSPQGKKAISDAVLQVIAPEEMGGLVKLTKFREDVAPFLKSSNLMSEGQIAALETQLRTIYNSALGQPAKLNMMQTAVKNAIIGVTAQPVGAATATSVKSAYDIINNKGSVGSASRGY